MKKPYLIFITYILIVGILATFTFLGFGSLGSIVSNMKLGLDIEGGVAVVYEAKTDLVGEELDKLIVQTKQVLENRVNELGLTEPQVSVQGQDRIRIELPGVKNIQEAIDAIGKTAQLEFALVSYDSFAQEGMDKSEFISETILTGDKVKDSSMNYNEDNQPVVSLEFTSEGANLFHEATTKAVNFPGGKGQIAILLDNKVISAPYTSIIIADGKAIIEGSFTIEESSILSSLIRGGALPVELVEIESSIIGPTLGQQALKMAIIAGLIGFILVSIYMIIFYKFPGLVSVLGLILYATLLMQMLVAFKATLTLPGIAGILLSIGMAVDANVIIFERIKEEVKNGKSMRASVVSGFKRAFTTIVDSNVTTLIAALILFIFGTGPIKGFAVTLSVGILTSMFSALVITRFLLVNLVQTKGLSSKKLYGVKEA
jgi:protein-export membrane protein SecD